MRSYTMKKIQGTPDWSTVPVLQIDNLLWTDSIDVSAQAQVCWDDENLYLRMEAVEPNIRMEEKGTLAEVCLDSCLEFFFRPSQSRMDYFNIEMNPNRAIWLGCGTGISDLTRLLVPKVATLLDSKVEFTDGGWVLSYRVPFAFIRRFFPDFVAEEGGKIHANFYKCGDKTVKRHYLAWNPVTSKDPAFHRPQDFGCLIFGGE